MIQTLGFQAIIYRKLRKLKEKIIADRGSLTIDIFYDFSKKNSKKSRKNYAMLGRVRRSKQ